MLTLARLLPAVITALALAGRLSAQDPAGPPRRLPPAQTGCDSLRSAGTDSVYESDAVDKPVEARRLPVEDMPFRAREVLDGHSTLVFVVEPSGRIDGCSIALVEETTPAWTDAVLKELRFAHYQPARLGGQKVRQRVYQMFTYHQDGRLLHGR